jgi:hypothetical protein
VDRLLITGSFNQITHLIHNLYTLYLLPFSLFSFIVCAVSRRRRHDPAGLAPLLDATVARGAYRANVRTLSAEFLGRERAICRQPVAATVATFLFRGVFTRGSFGVLFAWLVVQI